MPGDEAAVSGIAHAAGLDHASLLGFDEIISRATWFTPLLPELTLQLAPGALPDDVLAVPQGDAQKVLREVVRLVADLPTGTTPVVVWQLAGSELWVDTSSTALTCRDGVVTVSVTVTCDELDEPLTLPVPIAVGTRDAPTGLVMSTFDRLDGPALVTDRWSDAVTAYAWESLVELARRLCARLGDDARGRPLVPGGIASASGVLLVQPMARHELSGRR